jgi:hypothetical protein
MRRKTTGSRAGYGVEINALLSDYCAAVHNPPERNVVRDAIEFFVRYQLEHNAGINRAFEEARKKRLTGEKLPLRIINPQDA